MRSVTVREPEWTDSDRAWVAALTLWRSEQCPLHGGPLSECTSHYEAGIRFKPDMIRCRATDALLNAKEAAKNMPNPDALLWTVRTVLPRKARD